MAKFELNRLISYSNDSLLAEIRRVAALIHTHVITQDAFDKHSKVSFSTIQKRFGGWKQALTQAGVGDRYGGSSLFTKGHQRTRKFADEELMAELHAVAKKLGTTTFTMEEFNKHAPVHAETLRRRFGSWWAAMKKAGLEISSLGKRYSDDDYFENLLNVWTHYGRQPKYREMDQPPSSIPSGAYEAKWGTWTKALLAFIDRANSDIEEGDTQPDKAKVEESHVVRRPSKHAKNQPKRKVEDQRTISLGLRFEVFSRDRFRCVICGASPATDLQCQLHVDHKVPFSRGGKTVKENLQTTCMKCNLGKSNKTESNNDI